LEKNKVNNLTILLAFSVENKYLQFYKYLSLIVRSYSQVRQSMHLQRFSWRFFVATKLYVGNLPFNATEDEVKEYFSTIGEVQSVKIISDRDTGRSRGFCFVEMQNADAAITELNGKEMNGRKITVSEAREREQRGGGGGGGYGGGDFKKRFNEPRG
jgi:hypothetical protein